MIARTALAAGAAVVAGACALLVRLEAAAAVPRPERAAPVPVVGLPAPVAPEAARLRGRIGAARAALQGLRPQAAEKVARAVARQQSGGWVGVWDRVGDSLVRTWTRELRLGAGQSLRLREILDSLRAAAGPRAPDDPRPLIPLAEVAQRFRPELNADQAERMDAWVGGR